jgi:hypothetical protein
MNLAKTDVLEGDDLMREAREIEHSAVDDGFLDEPANVAPLDELVDKLLANPEHASRTSLRFVSTRMRWHYAYDRVPDFVDNAHRLPQAADHIARLFRASGIWRDLPDWYREHCRSEWGSMEWSAAQLGTMFPSTDRADVVRDHFADVLSAGSASLPLMTVAAERLAAWDPDTARVVIREAGKHAAHPLLRRTLALAALHAGEERALVRRLLGEFEENSVTVALLEDRSWKPLKVLADFDHSSNGR